MGKASRGKAQRREKAASMKTIKNTPATISGVELAGYDGIKSNTAAWRLDMIEYCANRDMSKDQEATVDAWIVHAPWANMVWSDYILYCVHLRQIEGQSKAPVIHKPGATHEIGLYALNPDHVPCLDGSGSTYFLTPANYVGQFIADSDDHARQIIEHTVRMICEGKLNPDTDARKHWKQLFGDDCFKKPETPLDKLLADGGGAILGPDGKPIVAWDGQEPPKNPPTH